MTTYAEFNNYEFNEHIIKDDYTKEDNYIKSFLLKTQQEIKKELNKLSTYCEDKKEEHKENNEMMYLYKILGKTREAEDFADHLLTIEIIINSKEYIYFSLLDLITPKPKDMWGDRKRQ